jgi:mRNA interferase MazF
VVVISADDFLVGVDHELIVVVPLSSSLPSSALRPRLGPETGIDHPSAAICRGIRGIARSRLLRRLGEVDAEKMAEIERAVGLVLATA